MSGHWKRFAPFGLYLALLALLAAGVLYTLERSWNLWLQIALGLVVVGLAAFAALDPERVRRMFTGRQAKYGSNLLVLSLAFAGILVVVNAFVFENSKRWDLTEDKQNTLAAETLETLSRLPQPVEVTAFYTTRMNSEGAKTLLDQYKFNSRGKLDYRFIDPEADPITAQEMNITRDGTMVFRMGANVEQVFYASEKDMTSALVRVISGESVSVYFLSGHGERDVNGSGDTAMSMLKSALESKNYSVKTLNLLAEGKVPEEARLIVIAGPQQPVSSDEVALLKAYLEQGGGLFVLEEPIPVTSFGEAADPLADYLAQEWGVTLGKDIVVDLNSQQPLIAVANEYASHEITQKLQGMITYYPGARSVRLTAEDTSVTGLELVRTANRSWGETDFTSVQGENAQASADPTADLIGPVPVAVVAEKLVPKQRLVVFGDADFATDAHFASYGNGDLFINALDWASQREEILNLTPKEPVQRLLIPPQRYTMGAILLGSVFLLPGSVLVAGVVAFIQKRRRG